MGPGAVAVTTPVCSRDHVTGSTDREIRWVGCGRGGRRGGAAGGSTIKGFATLGRSWGRGRGGDRAGQVRTTGVRVRRHRHRPQPTDARPRGRRHHLGDRRLHVPAAAAGVGHGRCGLPGHGDRDRSSRWRRRAQPRGPLDPLRRPGSAPRGDRPPRRREGHPAHAGHLPRADPARAGHRAHPADPRRRRSSPSPRSPRSAPTSSCPPSGPASSTCSSSRARWCRPSTSPRTGSRSTS